MIRVISVHPHYRERGFVLIAENRLNSKQYAMLVNDLGSVVCVVPVRGTVRVAYEHRGWGCYEQTIHSEAIAGNDFTLDPICNALLERGWSQSLLRLSAHRLGRLTDLIIPADKINLEARWNGSGRDYYIVCKYGPDGRLHEFPKAAIHSHLEDHGHLAIHAAMPHIYQDEKYLKWLLDAIGELPSPSTLPDVHPCQLASTS